MIDLIIYNDRTAFSPSVLRSGVQVGGFEVACEQISSGIASLGRSVFAYHNVPTGPWSGEKGVNYITTDVFHGITECKALITARACKIPEWTNPLRKFTTCVDDPRGEPNTFDHLKGKSRLVHLSEWQASLYKELGHRDNIVIPSMIADEYYDLPKNDKVPGRFVCVNAWNKGTEETLYLWYQMRKNLKGCELLVGSPYSHPPDAQEKCALAGARWIGTLSPLAVVDTLQHAEAVFRVCVRPETFGVADAIAEVVGTRVHCWCVNGYGAARDVLSSEFLVSRPETFAQGVYAARGAPLAKPRGDYRVSTVIKEWERVLFG